MGISEIYYKTTELENTGIISCRLKIDVYTATYSVVQNPQLV